MGAYQLAVVPIEQGLRIDLQRFGNPHHDEQAGIAPAALDAANIGQVDTGIKGELFLSQSGRLAQPSHIPTNNAAPVYHYQRNGDRAYIL